MADSEGVVAPAGPASEPTPATAWRIGGLSLASGFVVSAALHLVLVGGALVVAARALQSQPAPAMTVDLVTPEELAAITQKAAEPDKPNPETKPELKPKPDPKPEFNLDTAAAAQPPSQPPSSQAPATVVASAAAADAFAMPFLPKSPPPRAANTEPPLGPAAQLATLVGAPSVTDLNGGGVSEFKANLATDEIAAFAAKVQSCWSAPANLAREPKLYVVLRVSLRRDGSLGAEPALQVGAASTLGPALLESAKRALHKCAPYSGLPAAKYDEWRVLDLRFVPTGLANASTIPNGQRAPGAG
jgi:hypothetical protein